MNAFDRLLVFGGLMVVVAVFLAFLLFPLYELRDEVVVRRHLWNPPVTSPSRSIRSASVSSGSSSAAIMHGLRRVEDAVRSPAF